MLVLSSHQALRDVSANGSHSEATRVVVIGNFDGVHLGHRELFAQARRLAPSTEVIGLTFWPHPARLFAPQVAPPLIVSQERRREQLLECGVDILVEQRFDRDFAGLSPTDFVDQVLLGSLQARFVVVGHDFTFGKGRAGSTETLRTLLKDRGAEAIIVPAFTVRDPQSGEPIICSSTLVRREVQAGRPERAALILGRDPEVEGEVVRGAARGRTLGFPTANLHCQADLRPAVGIYAAWAEILRGAANDGLDLTKKPADSAINNFVSRLVLARHPAAVSVGYNSTFTAGDSTLPPLSIEAHLIEPPGTPPLAPFYGRTVRLHLRARLRNEERFSSVESLVAQIGRDIDATRSILGVAL